MLSGIINYLDSIDKALTVTLNFDGGSVADLVAVGLSSRCVWVPVGVWFVCELAANHGRDLRRMAAIVIGLAVVVALCDQVSASVIKPLFARLRPSHDVDVAPLLHYVGTYRGGMYGFVSSHAANALGASVYTLRFIRVRRYAVSVLLLALLVGYSRVYLGVHYVGDVVCGSLLGAFLGFVVGRAVLSLMAFRWAGWCRFNVRWPFVTLQR